LRLAFPLQAPTVALLRVERVAARAIESSVAGSSGDPVPRSCTFDVLGRRYDLSPWTNRTIVAHNEQGGSYNVSLCQNLRDLCHDSLTGVAMPPGSAFSMFAAEAPGTCWDVLAHWADLKSVGPPTASASQGLPGLTLTFAHPFDAHLGCETVTVAVSALCNRSVPAPADPTATGAQVAGKCDWHLAVQTAHPSVCEPAAIPAPAASTPSAAAPPRGGDLAGRVSAGLVGVASLLRPQRWARAPSLLLAMLAAAPGGADGAPLSSAKLRQELRELGLPPELIADDGGANATGGGGAHACRTHNATAQQPETFQTRKCYIIPPK